MPQTSRVPRGGACASVVRTRSQRLPALAERSSLRERRDPRWKKGNAAHGRQSPRRPVSHLCWHTVRGTAARSRPRAIEPAIANERRRRARLNERARSRAKGVESERREQPRAPRALSAPAPARAEGAGAHSERSAAIALPRGGAVCAGGTSGEERRRREQPLLESTRRLDQPAPRGGGAR